MLRRMIRVVPHAAHWGAFSAVVEDDRLVGVRPFGDDPEPSVLISGMPDIVHSPMRIDRPYVRKGWLDGDRQGGNFRGGEAFVPVDWDTATRLVAGELARVRDMHGPASVFGGSYGWSSAGRFHHAKTQLQRMLSCVGGFTTQITSYSYSAAQALVPRIVGNQDSVVGPVVDWRGIVANAKLMVCFGGLPLRNGQIGNGASGQHEMGGWVRKAAASGVKFVNVSPMRADMPDGVNADWIPIRPGTDAAFMLAMAQVLITQGRADVGFLDRCTVGFDRFADYVMGRTDGVVKTPEWAAVETGVPAATIRDLALQCAAMPTMLTAAWSVQRAEYGEQPYWALIALAAMLGDIGKPGLGFSFGHGSIGGMGNPRLRIPSAGMTSIPNPANSVIPSGRLTDMLEKPRQAYDYNGVRKTYPDIRMICWAGGNPFHHHQDLNRLLRAWARVETIVVNEPWWTAVARHADIVLPATTTLERNDIASSIRDKYLLAMHQAVPKQHQARDDFSIFADIADALGVREQFTEQRDEAAWLRVLYARVHQAAAGKGVDLPGFEEFWDRGHVLIPVPDEPFTPFADFARDPQAHKLATPSGRIEIYSETIAGFGYDDCPGHPVWMQPREYLGSPLTARYPLHLLSSQPANRLHSQLDQARVAQASKVQGREPLWMHPDDAAARGLAAGDVARVFNDRGACLAGICLTTDLLRGVVMLPTGAWFDPEMAGEPGTICVHGNPNILTQDVGTSKLGQGQVAQSCLVEIARWVGELPPVKAFSPPVIVG